MPEMDDPIIIENPLYGSEDQDVKEFQRNPLEKFLFIGDGFNPVRNFAQRFARRSFIILKLINLFFLAIVAVGLVVTPGVMTLYFTNAFNAGNQLMWQMSPSLSLVCIMAAISLFLYWYLKKAVDGSKYFITCLAIVDICLGLFCAANLLATVVGMAIATTGELVYYIPRFSNSSMTLEQLTEYTPYRQEYDNEFRGNNYKWEYDEWTTTTRSPPTTATLSQVDWHEMETREQRILGRLAIDIALTLLALAAMVLQLVYVMRVRAAIKRTHLWNSDYSNLYPDASDLDKSYAQSRVVSLAKFFNWIIPIFIIMCIMHKVVYVNNESGLCLGMSFFWFMNLCHWLFYLRKSRFNSTEDSSNVQGGKHRFIGSCKVDCFVAVVGIIGYAITANSCYNTGSPVKILSLSAIFFLILSLGYSGRLLYTYGEKLNLVGSLPTISINLSINVTKKGDNGKVDEEDKEVKSEQENINVEKQNEKNSKL